MATFEELMGAAANADAAGDEAAARQLVQEAIKIRDAKPEATDNPQHVDLITPRAYDPTEDVATKKVDRFGDTIAAAVEGPRAVRQAFTAGLADQDQSITMQNMPDWVPGPLRRPAATIGDTAGAGLALAGEVYAGGAGLVGEALGGTPTNERKLARDLMMMGEVSAPELAGVSSASVVARGAAKAAKPATPVQRVARAADDLGVTPSLGAGGKVRGMTAAGLEKVPFTGGVIGRDAARYVGEVERAFDAATSKIGRKAGPVGAGDALQSGARKFVADFKEKSATLYAKVGEAIPGDTRVSAPETVAMIRDAIKPFEGNPEIARQLGLGKWAALADDLEGGISWEAAMALRSDIGKSIGKINGPLKDMDQGRLSAAYGKLTDDLGAAASAVSPGAKKAWSRASNYYRRGAERIESALDKTIKADSPERAIEAFAAMTKKDRTSADSRRLFQIKASIPKQEWRTVSASIIDRLGRAANGAQNADGDVFSPSKFLTEWNKLSPEAKSALLEPASRREMDKIALLAEGIKSGNMERNFSNTGTANGILATLAGTSVDFGATAATLGVTNLSARALTSQRFLRALNKSARGDLKQMRSIANGSSPYAQDAATILRMSAADAAGAGAANANSAVPLAAQN